MSAEQSRYQIRLDWGIRGAEVIGDDADVIVWVDAIPDAAASVILDALPTQPAVLESSFPTAAAVADWISTLQKHLARRITIAVVAAGVPRGRETRFAVEDQLAAGAIIDRLAQTGLDATSPEAAAAEGAYLHLVRAVGHLATASVSAAGGSYEPSMFRVNMSLGREDVLVRRHHPQA